MKKFFFALLLSAVAMAYAQKNQLKFNSDGELKILQFTDIHWSNEPKYTNKTTETLRRIIAAEKPDFIVLDGDNVNCIPMRDGWRNLGKIIEEAGVPWTLVFGNHDAEQDWTNAQSFDFLKTFPHFVGKKGSVAGVANFSLPVHSSRTNKPAATLYFLDSGDYTRNPKLGNYAWIKRDQISWYAEESERIEKSAGKTLPALMFFHIPLPEFAVVAKDPAKVGEANEDVSSAAVNSGLMAAILERKDVIGVFCGHDHDNNYIGSYRGVALGYGAKTGNDGYGRLEQGGRVITLKEDQFAFSSYLSLPSGRKFPYSFPSGLSEISEKTKVLKAQNVKPSNEGLHYSYYEGKIKSVKEIGNLKELKSGTATKIDLENAAAEDHFALSFSGYIRIPETAFYKFYSYSDDGSVIKIDGQTIVDNDGGHSAQRKEGIVALEKGYHKIEVLYFEDYMGQVLDVGISSIGIPEQNIPAEMLSH